jgi:hypothetical protein
MSLILCDDLKELVDGLWSTNLKMMWRAKPDPWATPFGKISYGRNMRTGVNAISSLIRRMVADSMILLSEFDWLERILPYFNDVVQYMRKIEYSN